MEALYLATPLLETDHYRWLKSPDLVRESTLARLAHTIFLLEKALVSQRPRVVQIGVPETLRDALELDRISAELRKLLNLVLVEDLEFEFSFSSDDVEPLARARESADAVCLFSGGVDSLCGILDTAQRFNNIRPLFCSHTDQSKIHTIVDSLRRRLPEPLPKRFCTMRVPPIQTGGYAQTRGFLYLLSGAAVAHATGSNRLVISEVGPTMYQPRFGPLDEVTMTTHPYVVRAAQSIATLILGTEPEFHLPFEDCTKAEVLAGCLAPRLLRETHSCISQRFGTHDGTCYGCVVRNLSARAAAVPDVEYRRDPIVDDQANAENLAPLLDFCADVLMDYAALPLYRKENIELFAKRDLFERFSLDLFCGLHRTLLSGQTLSSVAAFYHARIVKDLGEATLCDRMEQLEGLKKVK